MAKIDSTTKDPKVSVYNDLEDEIDITMTVTGEFDDDTDDDIDRLIDQVNGTPLKESASDDDDLDDDDDFEDDDDDEDIESLDTDYSEVHDEPTLINQDVNEEIMAERDVFFGPDEDGDLIDIVDATVEPEEGPDDEEGEEETAGSTDAEDAPMNEAFDDTGEGRVKETAIKVMAAYQNANKWLDIIKEYLFTKLSCVYFASYIHNLAHTMPGRFDKFGDILHTVNMEIPYPPTGDIPHKPDNVKDAIDMTFVILKSIQKALNEFIEATDKEYHGMACSAETLLNDIENEFIPLYRIDAAWDEYNDNMRFDKWVALYVKERSSLAESANMEPYDDSKDLEDFD